MGKIKEELIKNQEEGNDIEDYEYEELHELEEDDSQDADRMLK